MRFRKTLASLFTGVALTAAVLASDVASMAMAEAMDGQRGIDAARATACMALPGSGAATQVVLPTSEIAASLFSKPGVGTDCPSAIARLKL